MSAFTKTGNLNSSVNFKARPRRTRTRPYSMQRAAGRLHRTSTNELARILRSERPVGKKRDRVILNITEHLFVLAGTFNWVFEWR